MELETYQILRIVRLAAKHYSEARPDVMPKAALAAFNAITTEIECSAIDTREADKLAVNVAAAIEAHPCTPPFALGDCIAQGDN